MKKISELSTILLISQLFLLEGCLWPTNWSGSGGGYGSQTYIDQKQIYKQSIYADEMPFKMRDGITQAPLMSQKGQVNTNFDFIHGTGIGIACAISDHWYIQGGISLLNTDKSTEEHSSVPAKTVYYYSNGSVDTVNTIAGVYYNFKSELNVNSFYATIGRYLTFNQNGRFEYCAGFSHGSAKNNYTFDFEKYNDYSFIENRKFNNYFLQTDFGYVTKSTEGALILKASCYDFYDRSFKNDLPVATNELKNAEFVLEPAIKFGCGGRFRLYFQYGWNIPLGNHEPNYYGSNVQAGITIRLHDKLWN